MAKKKSKVSKKIVSGKMFFRNVLAFDENGKLQGQIEFSIGGVRPMESIEETEARLEKFEKIAMQFLAGEKPESWADTVYEE